jgi:hypothetical protein
MLPDGVMVRARDHPGRLGEEICSSERVHREELAATIQSKQFRSDIHLPTPDLGPHHEELQNGRIGRAQSVFELTKSAARQVLLGIMSAHETRTRITNHEEARMRNMKATMRDLTLDELEEVSGGFWGSLLGAAGRWGAKQTVGSAFDKWFEPFGHPGNQEIPGRAGSPHPSDMFKDEFRPTEGMDLGNGGGGSGGFGDGGGDFGGGDFGGGDFGGGGGDFGGGDFGF